MDQQKQLRIGADLVEQPADRNGGPPLSPTALPR
jgi:hypothetical protein